MSIRRVLALAAGCAVPAVVVAQGRAAARPAVIPTPESAFGFSIGSDGNLVDYDQSIAYFRRLAAASNRIHLQSVGRTSFGRDWIVAIITSPENWARLDHYRQINQRLAHPSGLTDSSARRLAREGRVIVDISGGLHATEIAGAQHTPQLAYELISRATEPATKEILDNVIFFLWPTINPDGMDIAVKNCRETMAGRPPLTNQPYEKYMGHDNNRDSYMMNGIESRVRQRVWREWEPAVIYVHHQSSPFPTRIWIPPFADPIGLRAPPIISSEINTIGTFIAQELSANGQPGAAHMLATFDAYYPGYIDYMPVYQNIAAWWTETQGGGCATTVTRGLKDLPPNSAFRSGQPTALYVNPWDGEKWSLRDAVDVMVTASRATLRFAAKFREDLLYNRYRSGRDVIAKYLTKGPFAYIVPAEQRDPMAPVELLRRFAFHGVRISRLERAAAYDGVTYPAGTWVIPMDQEFASLVQEVFEVQRYPDMGDDLPYDASGWTLPYQMGVHVVEAARPLTAEFREALAPVPPGRAVDWRSAPDAPLTMHPVAAGIDARPGRITGTGELVLIDPAQNNSFSLLARALDSGGTVRFAPRTAGGARYVLSGVAPAKLDAWAAELRVKGERAAGVGSVAVAGSPPRVALGPEGMAWTEWLFDRFGIRYAKVTNADLAAGGLASRFDVLVLPGGVGGGGRGRGGPPAGVVAGVGGAGGGAGAGAAAGRAGRGGAPPGPQGPGAADVTRGVEEFARAGGTVLTWGTGAVLTAAALRLPVRSVTQGLSNREYFTGISIMQVVTDTTHPLMAGMPERADVTVQNPPSFTTTDGFDGAVIAKFPSDASPLRSGFLTAGAEKLLNGHAAALDVRLGAGHVVLLAFNPNWRGQPFGTFRVIFNSLYFGKEVAAQARGEAGFWTQPAAPR